MPNQPTFNRTPDGEFLLSEPIADLGFSIGGSGTSPQLRLQTTSGNVIWAEVPKDQIERFVRQWQKLLGL